MDVKVIYKNTILISNIFDIKSLYILNKYIKNLKYERKKSNMYSCLTHLLNKKDLIYLNNILNFKKISLLSSKYFGKYYNISNIGEVVKMGKGDFLCTHTDSFHKIQGVLYLSDIYLENGGEFIIEKYICTPKIGNIILFKGNINHSVGMIKTDYIRFSISFGFK